MFTISLKRTVCVISALAAAGCQSTAPKKAAAHVPATAVPQTAEYVKGRNLYALRCGTCHRLHEINEYKLDEWKPILDSMAPLAKLSGDQKAAVFAYISGVSQSTARR